ncbi:hypothetical protein OEZ85_011042 [Tetradesmus obliquus]|uniref:Tim44-like domain-containing protein n=1 Tax=Tetradesmus obliquus TaxID=3088 RepID=A0ABY8TSY7_TETOB|nr:hypothetical protein OEZ85_011042 [Tetradesmus obliquus]
MLVVALESPPGGGKGFLLKYLASKGLGHAANVHVALHDDAIHHLMDMNTDGARWAFFTELFFLSNHIHCYRQACKAAQQAAVLLLEGSPVSDRLCYYEHHMRERMHPLEAQLYEEWYAKLLLHWRVDHHVLLLADMHAHMQRIIDNAKVEQAGLMLDDVHAMMTTACHLRRRTSSSSSSKMEATRSAPPRRFDEIDAETDVCFDFLPQTAKFGKGWVVACSSDPLPLLQTPKMRAPGGCLETVAYQQSATASRPKLSLALAVEDERFRAWYEGLEEHVIRLVEQRCHKWFGKHANEVQPSVRDAFFSCMRPDDMRPQHVLTFSVPTRGDAVLVNFFAADGSTIPHTSVLKHHEVACRIELEGLWFANLRWGLRWRLTDVKTYGAGSTGAPSDFAFVQDSDDDDA